MDSNLYIRCEKKVITILFVFLEKKSIKNQIGKSCVDRKDCSKPSH